MQKTLNVKNFESLLKKVTLDNTIPFCQLNFSEGMIETSVIATTRDIVIKHNMENNFIGGLGSNDELTLSFMDPHLRIMPQLKALEGLEIEEAEIEISDERLKILTGQWGGGTIHFCDDAVLANNIMRRNPRELNYFHSIVVTPEMHYGFKPIKAIAPTYGKIYFTVENSNLYLETGDKTNVYTDNYKLPLANDVGVDDLTVCFDFSNFNSMMNVMAAEENKKYNINFAWENEDERGMMYIHTDETDENYYLFSRAN